MLVYAGIDEAGYGPMLGPLTTGSAVFILPNHDPATGAPSMWSLLHHAVSHDIKSSRGRIVINDSKKVKQSNKGKRHPLVFLEPAVLAFTALASGEMDSFELPEDDLAFYSLVSPQLVDQCRDLPWYAGDPIPLPLSVSTDAVRIATNVLRETMNAQSVSLDHLSCRVMTEPEFNNRVTVMRSKAAASFILVGQHLNHVLSEHGPEHPRVIVDRQGSRIHYRHPLQTLFPQSNVRITAETDRLSRYELRFSDGDVESGTRLHVSFIKSAESQHFPVALASMLAKYVRELMMMRFNRYFQSLMPELKPTAGYVTDARRFLKEIEPILHRLDLCRGDFIRLR